MRGKLFYIMGPSGSGKDTLLQSVRKQNKEQGFIIAHRYITRPAGAGKENHIALTNDEFLTRLHHGTFAMHWQSHGLYYGIGKELDTWLELGLCVLVNGSREYLATACSLYPELIPILVTVDRDILYARLVQRGREDAPAITKRMNRLSYYNVSHPNLVCIKNNTTVEEATSRLCSVLTQGED